MKLNGIKIVMLIAVMLISFTSFAAKGKKLTTDERATLQMQKIHQVCNLTPQQQAQVKQVFVTKLTARRELNAQKESNQQTKKSSVHNGQKRAQRDQAMKTSKQNTNQSMKSILTPAQVAKWQAHKQSQKK